MAFLAPVRTAWMLVACASAGCSPFHHSESEADLLSGNRYVMVTGLDAPEVSGVEGCGAQALATVINHLEPSRSSADVAADLPWHDAGATPVELLLEARRRGFSATVSRGSIDTLAADMHAGRPVLVMLDSGLEVRGLVAMLLPPPQVMHWAVVSGVALDQSQVLMAAEGPEPRHHVATLRDFQRRWAKSDNCMIVVAAAVP